MRVFCLEHKRGFFAPRQSPIKCENRGHILGEFDFQGDSKLPVELQWQYCCNCEHFCPIDFDHDGLERCPVCTRRSSVLYLCDRCHTISFESNTSLQIKNFTLTSEGAPQPSCPGCLRQTSADLHEHTCDQLGVSFITALDSCPLCLERLDIGPAFPSSVALYLKKTKSANKINVTFDYESAVFVPVEDGEFVVISNIDETSQLIVIPRSARFATRRDFYEFYQDYYHCAEPENGEVHIIQPAAVVPVQDGWKLLATGILEVAPDQPKAKALPDVATQRLNIPLREEPAPIATTTKESSVRPCVHCGSLIEARYAFCWKCGNSLTPKLESSATHQERPRDILSSELYDTEDDELTVQHEGRSASSQIFSWAQTEEPDGSGSARGSVLKLIAVAFIGLLLLSVGVFVMTRSGSTTASATAAQPVAEHGQSNTSVAPGGEAESEVATTLPRPTSALNPEDVALTKLREKRTGASNTDRSTIVQSFATAEKHYPNDYRFPYERAKLAMKGPRASSHSDAFKALSVAAAKAISAGKAREMLDSLEGDKSGDFNKLSHRHREWSQLLEALKNKNVRVLNASMGL